MWVRGLKPQHSSMCYRHSAVAPHVGAWIETIRRVYMELRTSVAPHVGAWIETMIT